jgi:hypothetical protein
VNYELNVSLVEHSWCAFRFRRVFRFEITSRRAPIFPARIEWMKRSIFFLTLLLAISVANGAGTTLKIEVPLNVKVTSAIAVANALKLQIQGKIESSSVVFEKLLPDTPYDVRLELSDGAVLQGVDLGWYDEEPVKAGAEAITDEDRKEIGTIVAGLQPFMNHSEILQLRGDHDRAVALCQFVRDKGFVNDKGGEIIWRVELWYFKYQAGGWEAVSQVNKILRRERFKSRSDYQRVVDKLKWVAELGGIRISADSSPQTIHISAEAIKGH